MLFTVDSLDCIIIFQKWYHRPPKLWSKVSNVIILLLKRLNTSKDCWYHPGSGKRFISYSYIIIVNLGSNDFWLKRFRRSKEIYLLHGENLFYNRANSLLWKMCNSSMRKIYLDHSHVWNLIVSNLRLGNILFISTTLILIGIIFWYLLNRKYSHSLKPLNF